MEQTKMQKPQNLADLIQILHQIFANDKIDVDEVQTLMESYQSDPREWMKYAKFDQYRYTRNLVDEGNGKFNLMILCWGEGHGSIHFLLWLYPVVSISGLVMCSQLSDNITVASLEKGQLKETLFSWPEAEKKELTKKNEAILQENQCGYISDSIGLHRVENVSHTEVAVSLHLYSPPFDSCNCFDQRTGHKKKVGVTFSSKYGELIPLAKAVSQENN